MATWYILGSMLGGVRLGKPGGQFTLEDDEGVMKVKPHREATGRMVG
jgi:hypothetical protein